MKSEVKHKVQWVLLQYVERFIRKEDAVRRTKKEIKARKKARSKKWTKKRRSNQFYSGGLVHHVPVQQKQCHPS